MRNKKSKYVWIYGKHVCLHKLLNHPEDIIEVIVTSNILKDHAFSGALKGNNVGVRSHDEISKIVGKGSVHQGIALKVKQQSLSTLSELLDSVEEKAKSIILMLDHITDPQNIGAIIRSAVAFDCDGIIVTKDNSGVASPVVAKAAAGNLEKATVVEVANLSDAIKRLKEAGYWVFGLDGSEDNDIATIASYKKAVLVLGSEGEGLRRLVKENCDMLVKIPMLNDVESLNVSNAAAIALYISKIGKK